MYKCTGCEIDRLLEANEFLMRQQFCIYVCVDDTKLANKKGATFCLIDSFDVNMVNAF